MAFDKQKSGGSRPTPSFHAYALVASGLFAAIMVVLMALAPRLAAYL